MNDLPAPSAVDDVAWARRVNEGWIVQHGLNDSLVGYLDHLAATDPERLTRSCQLAHRLVREMPRGEDPKPWFYGALFSLATEAEAREFLREHPLLAAIVPALHDEQANGLPEGLQSAGAETIGKIQQLREMLEREAGGGGM
jgi:hypothetical protein